MDVTWSQAVENSIIFGGHLAQFETDLELKTSGMFFRPVNFIKTYIKKLKLLPLKKEGLNMCGWEQMMLSQKVPGNGFKM